MVQKNIDHGRNQERDVDPLAPDRIEDRLRTEFSVQMNCAATHQYR
jgi:hypothetical protein